jgi:3-hydroxyacyl-CoA dehydrogenase
VTGRRLVAVVGSGALAGAWAAVLGTPLMLDAAGLGAAVPELARLDLVVDASPDGDPAVRSAALATLLAALPGRVPLAVATRRHTLGALLPGARHGPRVVGLHRIVRAGGPTPVVEVALHEAFDDGVVDAALDLLGEHGLEPLPTGDGPGRIVDRLLAAAWCAASGAGDAAAIAEGAAARGLPLDALPAADLAGIAGAIATGLGGAPRYEAALGEPGGPAAGASLPWDRVELAVIAEAYRLVGEAAAGAAEIEHAMTAGAGWVAGPFSLAGRRGLRGVVTAIAALGRDPAADPATADRYAMPPLLWRMATA